MNISNSHIKHLALKYGFEICGIAKIHNILKQKNYIDRWIDKKFNAGMDWFLSNSEIRLNPALLVENAKSVIVCAKYYNPQVNFGNNPRIAKYALSNDYHFTIKNSLSKMIDELGEECNARAFVDSAPILEKYWAECCGIGWLGKNGLITNLNYGSLLNLGVIVTDFEFDSYDMPTKNRCGTCQKCLEACPTSALLSEYVIDARRCLSYLTIEHRGEFDESQKELLTCANPCNTVFGCDICLDACPWNTKSKLNNGFSHQVSEVFVRSSQQWLDISTNQFRRLYRPTPLIRCDAKGFRRNVGVVCIGVE